MAGAWAAIGQAAANIGGSFLSQEWARRNARNQRDWEHEMSANAYQRTMADMKKAGLNPMLAYSQGANKWGAGAAAQTPKPAPISAVQAATAVKQTQASTKKLNTDNRRSQVEIQKAEIDRDYERGAQEYLDNNPEQKASFYNAYIAKKAGMRPEIGGLIGAISGAVNTHYKYKADQQRYQDKRKDERRSKRNRSRYPQAEPGRPQYQLNK